MTGLLLSGYGDATRCCGRAMLRHIAAVLSPSVDVFSSDVSECGSHCEMRMSVVSCNGVSLRAVCVLSTQLSLFSTT